MSKIFIFKSYNLKELKLGYISEYNKYTNVDMINCLRENIIMLPFIKLTSNMINIGTLNILEVLLNKRQIWRYVTNTVFFQNDFSSKLTHKKIKKITELTAANLIS